VKQPLVQHVSEDDDDDDDDDKEHGHELRSAILPKQAPTKVVADAEKDEARRQARLSGCGCGCGWV
jgi:hypothetical protein